jgi:hypothetical protein
VLFGKGRKRRDDFEREVLQEIAYLTELHGDSAIKVAHERAARPRLGGERKRVIVEAARRMAAARSG